MTQPATAQEKPAAPPPDVVIFKNGDQLTGKLERGEGNNVIFKSDLVGEVTISMDKVKELRSNGSFTVLKKDEKITRTSRQPGSITFADNNLTITHPNGSPETVTDKDLAYIIDSATFNREVVENPGIWYGWNGSITGGATVLQSTSFGQTLTAGISLIRAIPTVPYLPPRTRTTFNLVETYGKLTQPTTPQTDPPTPDAVAKTHIFHTDFEHDKYITERVYGLVGFGFDHNFSQGLDLAQIYGVGLGWTAIKDAKQELDLKVDIHYQRQNFTPPTVNLDLVGSSFGEAYTRTLPGKMLFTQSGTFIQSWNDTNAWSAIAAAGLALPVYHRFSLSVNILNNYLNNPAIGFKNNSFQFVSGITYTLH
ncbi:MAG TPA: DUF481 domain-containing protein [Edaphobacter sp.]|nr:DUF481 domain-containing protein [Edaphobacter sp.]